MPQNVNGVLVSLCLYWEHREARLLSLLQQTREFVFSTFVSPTLLRVLYETSAREMHLRKFPFLGVSASEP